MSTRARASVHAHHFRLILLWRTGQHSQATDALIKIMLKCNPGANEDMIRNGRQYDSDGMLQDWTLSNCGLIALPEEFGILCIKGDIKLPGNQIASLPQSFGSITVKGCLDLSRNLITSLPESFGNITVGGNLYLCENQITSLPESFGVIIVGGSLFLTNNHIITLPESFSNITLGGSLYSSGNQITLRL